MTKDNAELIARARGYGTNDSFTNDLIDELADALASAEANAREVAMNLAAEVTALTADREEIIGLQVAALRATWRSTLDWECRVEMVRNILAPPLSNREKAE